MAYYNPPVHNLPIFDDWEFNEANTPAYLDQLVVHKAGTEIITGDKTFTGTFIVNNLTKDVSVRCDDYTQLCNNYNCNALATYIQSLGGVAKLIMGLNNTDYKQNVAHRFNIGATIPISINSAGLLINTGFGITTNGLTISDVELGYLDGATSNIQTQINTKANDADVVHKTGNLAETITGQKTFTSNMIVAQRTAINKIEIAEANIGLGYSYIDYCSGGNNDYDVRLSSSGGTATLGMGDFVIEAGTIRNYAITSNTLEVNNVVKISTTSTDNVLNNTNNKLQVGGVDKITTSATITSITNDEVGIASTQKTTIASNNDVDIVAIDAISIYGVSIIDMKSDDKINISSGSGVVPQTQPSNSLLIESNVNGILAGTGQTPSSTFTNVIESNGTLTTANWIKATASGGGNKLETASGENKMETATGSNILSVNGTAKITTTSTDNVLNNTNNKLQVGGVNKITTTSTEVSTYGTTNLSNTSTKSRIECSAGGINAFLDFHSKEAGTTDTDFDTRIISIDGDNTNGGGTLTITGQTINVGNYYSGTTNINIGNQGNTASINLKGFLKPEYSYPITTNTYIGYSTATTGSGALTANANTTLNTTNLGAGVWLASALLEVNTTGGAGTINYKGICISKTSNAGVGDYIENLFYFAEIQDSVAANRTPSDGMSISGVFINTAATNLYFVYNFGVSGISINGDWSVRYTRIA